jgi:hypothetical protein
VVKICWDVTLNDLELINKIFGETFVFKISPNYASKNIPEKRVLFKNLTLNR